MFEELINRIIELPNYGIVFKIKIFFIVLSAIFAALLTYFILTTKWLSFLILYDVEELKTHRAFGARKKNKDWEKIIKRLDSGLESEYKLAIIDADNLLDGALQNMGFGGATLEEKLDKLTPVTLPNLDAVREIHNVRNRIVREPDFKLSKDEAKEVLVVYEKSLSDLQVL